jgi:predicted ATP-dependent protease
VERLIEHSARIVADSERLTTQLRAIVDLMQQADYWAGQQEATTVASEHVQQAIDAYNRRLSRIEEKMREEVVRRTLFIDTDGEKVGQINALSVVQMGNYAFGHPTRITASIRLGRGEVVDIEREAQMGGPIHSKGVLILSSFLRARYELERPLSLAASLVFEQSYGGVEGDSASSTELYALLSAISGAPISQSLAVTGSVNQLGQVQAIGGVNEKIEGFFDLCAARGLNGEQGALIPSANVKHLMLKQEVVEAVRAGKFHIYPIETIDQGIEVLTGIPVGERQPDGSYPEGTINRRVVDRLKELAEARRKAEAKEGERRRKPALRRQPRGRQASAQ